jgi:hypothetical protein
MNATKPTLPASIGGTEITRFKALRHGVLTIAAAEVSNAPRVDSRNIQRAPGIDRTTRGIGPL